MKITRIAFISLLSLSFSIPMHAGDSCKDDIVDIAVADENFSTLVAAVKAAGLVDTLKSEGPFTVFAPTNAAFAKLPAGTVEALLKDAEALKNILLYHVVPAKVPASVAVTLTEAKMANGNLVDIEKAEDGLFINDSKVIKTDIEAKNGVIHVIDTVLLSPAN
jgi:uncharacterized surface protein with fasciclin (FAS1) repeats